MYRQRRLDTDNAMQFSRFSALVASIIVVLAISSAGAIARPRHPKHHPGHKLVLPPDYAAWTRVANCEEGGVIPGVVWYNPATSTYPDALGIQAGSYYQFGGKPQPWGPVSLANRIAEIKVADRLIAAYHIGIPDQTGCASW